MSENKRKIGRPALREEQRKNRTFKFRMRGGMQEKLQADAAKSGRSVSEEIEYRLERSFDSDKTNTMLDTMIAAIIGPSHNAALLQMISNALMLTGDWKDNAESAQVAKTAISRIVEAHMGEVTPAQWETKGISAALSDNADPGTLEGHFLAKRILSKSGLNPQSNEDSK